MGYQEGKVQEKIRFTGTITSVQVRSTVWRYVTDNRTHNETGYNLFLRGETEGAEKLQADQATETDFSVAISEKQMQKLEVHIGDVISGTAWTKMYPNLEYADYYRAGALKKIQTGEALSPDGPPWRTDLPDLATYGWRGARMLDTRTYKGKCFQCKWATMSSVSIEYDWGVTQKHRFESFCYGPRNCPFYKMGRPRAVPYKDRGTYYDEGWLDEACTQNRLDDDE